MWLRARRSYLIYSAAQLLPLLLLGVLRGRLWRVPPMRATQQQPAASSASHRRPPPISQGTSGMRYHALGCDITKKGQSDQAGVPSTQVKRDHLHALGRDMFRKSG